MASFFIARPQKINSIKSSNPVLRYLFAIALLACAFGAQAKESPFHPAEMLVRTTSQKVLDLLKQPGIRNEKKRYHHLIDDLLLPHFDFTRMAKIVLGKNWKILTDSERREFTAEFRTLLVRNYSEVLYRHANSSVDYLPPRTKRNGRVTVRTVVESIDGNNATVDYSMHQAGGSWKIYNVIFEGISLVISLRRGFGAEVKAHGAQRLITLLKEKNLQEITGKIGE